MKWIDINETIPKPIYGEKILGHNGDYAFECEFDGDCWCNIGGETITHWMTLPPPPSPAIIEE